MIDFKLLRNGLGIAAKERAEITRVTGIGRFRLAMVEHGLLTLNPSEESTARLAIAYTMHRRAVALAAKLAQGMPAGSVPMSWEEYVRENMAR